MSRVIYSTPALILEAGAQGEAHKLYTLLTRELGTVRALAQSVRLERSKLRYALEPLSLVNVSLVSAKGGWRITTAEPVTSFFFNIDTPRRRALLFRIAGLLRRLALGESKDMAIFDLAVEGFSVLEHIEEDDVEGFEIVFVMRILESLGYGIEEADEVFYREDLSDPELYKKAKAKRKALVRGINQALELSGL